MSHESRLHALHQRFAELSQEVDALKVLRKTAFVPAPPMPQGPPPMDPAMMQGGVPMDPAMMQGGMQPNGAPMDPAMMQGGVPMDPAMMQGGAQPAPASGPSPIDPALIDQIVGLLEEMGQKIQQQTAAFEEFQNTINGELQELGEQTAGLEKRLAEGEAATADAKTRAGASW